MLKDKTCRTYSLKPWFHVQLLHAIILGSGRGYGCQSVCVTSHRKCRLTKSYCYYQPPFHWLHLIVKEKESLLNDNGCVPCSNSNTSTTSRDSTKRCHWLQHFCLMNMFQHVWKPVIIARKNCSALRAIIAHETTALDIRSEKEILTDCGCRCCRQRDERGSRQNRDSNHYTRPGKLRCRR